MEGSTWQDVVNSGVSGLLSGITGVGFANLLKGTTMSGMQAAATTTEFFSGMLDAALMGADPLIKQPHEKNNSCK